MRLSNVLAFISHQQMSTAQPPSDLIAGLPSAIFILIISLAILVCFCGSFFPYIYLKRYCERRSRQLAFEEQEEMRYGKAKRNFFDRFRRGKGDPSDPWIERKDPETRRIYYENTMTGLFFILFSSKYYICGHLCLVLYMYICIYVYTRCFIPYSSCLEPKYESGIDICYFSFPFDLWHVE